MDLSRHWCQFLQHDPEIAVLPQDAVVSFFEVDRRFFDVLRVPDLRSLKCCETSALPFAIHAVKHGSDEGSGGYESH